MTQKENHRGTFKMLAIAAGMILLCAVLTTILLAYTARPANSAPKAAPIPLTVTASVEDELPQNINIIVYAENYELSSSAVTPQYAAAITAELAQRVYEKPLKGRVFVTLTQPYAHDDTLFWDVLAEVEGGSLFCNVSTDLGLEESSRYYKSDLDWGWFDGWDAEAYNAERAKAEKATAAAPPADPNRVASEPERQAEKDYKRTAMLEFSASMADTPYASKAVELANTLALGNGAQATTGAVVMSDADPSTASYYIVEVQLDDGRYLFIEITRDEMLLQGYKRSDVTMAEALYG